MDALEPSWRFSPGGLFFLAVAGASDVPPDAPPDALAAAWNLARSQGLAPLFAAFALDHPALEWPESVRDAALLTRRSILSRNLQLLSLLERIRHAFDGAGIPWLSIKGPVFTAQFAGDLSLRASSDLDVLVRPDDVASAAARFRELGILSHRPPRPFFSRLGVRGHEHRFFSSSPRFLVELHWNFASQCYEIVDLDAAFRRSRVARLPEGSFPSPSAEDSLLFAALHGFGHRWERLDHAKVLDWILREPTTSPGSRRIPRSLDWDYVLYAAAKTRKTRALLLGLSLARDWLGSPLPDSILRLAEADPALPRLVRWADGNFAGASISRSRVGALAFKLRALETNRDRTMLLLRALAKPAINAR